MAILQISSGRSLMYSTKSVGPRMEPWGTTALTGYSYEDFPFRTTWSRLLIRKDEIRPNTRQKLHFWPILPFFWGRGGGGGGKKTFSRKSGCVTHTTSYGFLASCQNLEKINDPIPKKAPKQMEEWKDGQILFYRTPQAIVGGPTKSQDAN